MSILIRGIEMPKSCWYCPFKYRTMEGDECMFNVRSTEYQKRPDDCPLIHVQEHGRLIDADAVMDKVKDEKGRYISQFAAVAGETIDAAPTIIPADLAEEGE